MLLVIFYQASFLNDVVEFEGTLYLHYVTESIYIT